jgi:hypothetical protein
MTHTIQLRKTRDGSTFNTLDIDDYAADNTTGTYKVLNISISNPAPEVLSHVPDIGDSHIVNYKDGDRLAVILLNVFSAGDDDFDEPLNAIADLRRWGREAFNRELDGSTWPIQLYVKRESTSNATIHYVKGGWIDDSASQFRGDIVDKKESRDVVLNLWLSPYGIAESAVTLQNDLLSSPHMVEDSDSDNLADGWVVTGTPTTQSNTTRFLIGGRSQQLVTDASTAEGIRADVAVGVAPISSNIVAYAWVQVGASMDPITIQLTDGAGTNIDNIEHDQDAPTGYDKTAQGANDTTWYRYVVSGVNSGAAGARLIIQRTAGNATIATTFRVDACYLEVGTLTAPDAWMSARNIDNRGDIQSTSSATENYLIYWDVWGVPGDAPALVKTKFDWAVTVASQNLMNVGKIADGELLAADEVYWIDDAALAVDATLRGTWTQPAGAGRTEGQYRRFTDDGGGSPYGLGSLEITFTDADARSFLHNPKKVMLLTETSNISTDYSVEVYSGSTTETLWASDTKNLDYASQWAYLDMGTISLRDLMPLDIDDAASQSVEFHILLTMNTDGATADIDAVLFLPTDEQILIAAPSSIDFNPNTVNTYIDGRYKHAVNSDLPRDMPRQGTLWTVEPGSIMSRYIWAVQEMEVTNKDLAGNHDPTIAAGIDLSIWPRTRHLLGTE